MALNEVKLHGQLVMSLSGTAVELQPTVSWRLLER